MSTAVLPPQIETTPETRHRFSRAEVDQMAGIGILEGQRLELIDGDLINKMGQKPQHISAIQLVLEFLVALYGVARVRCQAPIEIASGDRERNFPEPDIAVLAESKPDYLRRHPLGNELMVAIEVAETSLYRDVTFKRDLYARAGVPEYWVVDLMGRQIIVYRGLADGNYTQVSTFEENESVALAAEPNKPIAISALLPAL
jgi:Uma2 family endonuclease